MPTFPSISGVIADFSQTDGTTLESLTNWVKYAGSNTSIITATGQGKLSAGTYSENGYEVVAGPNCEGYFTIPAKANGNQVGGAWQAFLMGLHPGSTSTDRFGYQVEVDTSTSGNPLIFIGKKTQPSTTTSVASTTSVAMSAGDKIGWRATVTGSTATLIEVFLFSSGSWNQTPILTYNDTTSPYTTAGAMAFGMGDTSTFPLRVDDIGFGTTVSSQGGPSSSTVRFGTATTGRKTGKAASTATVRFATTAIGTPTRGGPSTSTFKLATAATGRKTALSSHEEATAVPPFTQQVPGTLDLVRLTVTVTGAQQHGGPSASTFKLAATVAGRKTGLAPGSSLVRFATTAAGTQNISRSGPSTASVRFATTAAGQKTGKALVAVTVKLTPSTAGAKTGLAPVTATFRFTTSATGNQSAPHAGPSAATLRLTSTNSGRKTAAASQAATVRFTTGATGSAAPHAGPGISTLRLTTSATGAKTARGISTLTVVLTPLSTGRKTARVACAATVRLNATVQGRAGRQPIITAPAHAGYLATSSPGGVT